MGAERATEWHWHWTKNTREGFKQEWPTRWKGCPGFRKWQKSNLNITEVLWACPLAFLYLICKRGVIAVAYLIWTCVKETTESRALRRRAQQRMIPHTTRVSACQRNLIFEVVAPRYRSLLKNEDTCLIPEAENVCERFYVSFGITELISLFSWFSHNFNYPHLDLLHT